MLNYSNINRPILLDASMKGTSAKENLNSSISANSKRIAFKPSFLDILKTDATYVNDGAITPKTSRSTHHPAYNLNSSFSKSNHITPDKQKLKKQLSFVQIKAPPKEQNEREKDEADKYAKKLEFRTLNNDRSRKIIKNVMFKDIANGNQQQTTSKLRQTVTNTNSWLSKNNLPPRPIKTQADFDPESTRNDKPIRKKIESEYTTPQNKEDSNHSKFFPRNHNRNKTSFEEETELNLKFKQQHSQNITPRISQQKLTMSVNIKTSNPMSQTDPNGGYFQRVANKRLSSTVNLRQKSCGISLSDFQLGSCKGEGRFGKVFPAVHKKSGFLVAIKQIKKESVRLMLEQFTQELKINLYLNHSNVVKMYGFFHDPLHIYIIMEYMEEGSLYRFIKLNKKLKEEEVIAKLVEICEAVSYIHSLDVLHRDIKPQNIVISNGVCKLCDFGWAIYSKERRTTYCGTLDYVCPEILEGESYDNFVDIWAIGVLAFEMLTGKAPFYHISRQQTMKSIMKCDFGFPQEMSTAAKSFIKKSLQKNPDKRVTIEELLKDAFLGEHANFH